MYSLILAAALLGPSADRPYHFTVSHLVSPDAVILLELPVPEAGSRYKRITLEQFRKHGPLISYLEYELVSMRLDGLVVKRAVFALPKPPRRDGQSVVGARP